ncbi:hypothetical protein CROQUDRAFT_73486 [Cronartium quercuum f. sp. fusiforme G11]|uniref:Uncharacterized protein n=1 Tax=Cronartium quercuum f. sp. fusiforme G11 TaxID=708437 RepID=A0A9P6TF03_9BASI|nr:hypothetical protein CROQUDRAFT_73486 [Cronartium quercuum f. sp. fusiforme G11]
MVHLRHTALRLSFRPPLGSLILHPLSSLVYNQRLYETSSGSPDEPLPAPLAPIQIKRPHGASPLYHHVPSGLVSFLPQPPTASHSATVLGRLVGQSDALKFSENSPFLELMHTVLNAAFLTDSHVLALARARQCDGADGYTHVFDQRQPESTRAHRGGPSADSIIFSFLTNAEEGKPVAETYEPNPSYRVWTPTEGFMLLPESLEKKLVEGCKIAREIELEENVGQ